MSPAANTPQAIAKTGSSKKSVKNIAPKIILKLKAMGVAAGMEKRLKEFNIDPKKATKDTKNK